MLGATVARDPLTGPTNPSGEPRSVRLVGLEHLMQRSTGRPEIVIGLIDGPVATDHPDLSRATIRTVEFPADFGSLGSVHAARAHGTFVAGILGANRGGPAPAICPDCTLLVRPIFGRGSSPADVRANPEDLITALRECVDAGVRLINLSSAILHWSRPDQDELSQTLNYAARHGVVVVAATGNQGAVGASTLIRHHSVVPVVGFSLDGQIVEHSNLGASIARRGIGAPGEGVISLDPVSRISVGSGTSVSAPFVTGTLALLLSLFPWSTGLDARYAIAQASHVRRRGLVPPLLWAEGAYQFMKESRRRG